jgi:hypothetical protein
MVRAIHLASEYLITRSYETDIRDVGINVNGRCSEKFVPQNCKKNIELLDIA